MRPVAFASLMLTKREQGYAQIEKEALAIIWACERFKDFVVQTTFLIETDHKPLVPIFTTKDLSDLTPRLQRYRMRMLQFSFHIFHTPVKDLITADALSRQPLPGHLPEDEKLQEEVEHFVRNIVLHQSTTDDRLAKIALNQKLEPTLQKVFYDVRDVIGEENGSLMRGLRVIIPSNMRKDVLNRIHAGHQGITKCRARTKGHVRWPGIGKEIQDMPTYSTTSHHQLHPALPATEVSAKCGPVAVVSDPTPASSAEHETSSEKEEIVENKTTLTDEEFLPGAKTREQKQLAAVLRKTSSKLFEEAKNVRLNKENVLRAINSPIFLTKYLKELDNVQKSGLHLLASKLIDKVEDRTSLLYKRLSALESKQNPRNELPPCEPQYARDRRSSKKLGALQLPKAARTCSPEDIEEFLRGATLIINLEEGNPLSRAEISQAEICAAIRRLPMGKSVGWDELPCELIRGFEDFFAPVLQQIFEASQTFGALPSSTRHSEICFIPKPHGGPGHSGLRPIPLPPTDYRVHRVTREIATSPSRHSSGMPELRHLGKNTILGHG
ncbi:K02A2.6-like [Cordylochernes scorpioides]|uniref:RNA-directed DNA polymerase n=1 Tax=Cordylochernes scorpioides TaxID=51811 RepID=A0ABY6K8H7_9ARAC|nr:K02A2.6-like [Cordylochernes scorpioides]